MNIYFSSVKLSDEAVEKALRKCVAKGDSLALADKIIAAGLLWICGKVIFAQHKEIVQLRKEIENSKKGE